MSINWYGQRGPLTSRDGVFYDAKGERFAFQGVSWFGFDLNTGMLDGLNKAFQNKDLNTGLVRDYKVVAARIKLLGFNTIRVPFAFSVRCSAELSYRKLLVCKSTAVLRTKDAHMSTAVPRGEQSQGQHLQQEHPLLCGC